MKNKYVVLKWWASLTGLPVAKYCWVCETCERSSIEQLKGGSGAGAGAGGVVPWLLCDRNTRDPSYLPASSPDMSM